MGIQHLIIIFNVVFLGTNLFYLELVERMFNIETTRKRKALFGVVTSTAGSVMLVFFGSMSALGYFIMLIVYIICVFSFYRQASKITKIACVLSFNLHIMAIRALISSIASLITGQSIYSLSANNETFWLILILTALFGLVMTMVMIYFLPQKFLNVIVNKTEQLQSYVALVLIANVYLIVNGNIYIHEVHYEYLQIHQIIAALTWLCASYVGIFMLVGFDIIRERREQLEKDNLFKQVVQKRYMALIELNCTKDTVTRIINSGVDVELPSEPYSAYYIKQLENFIFHEDFAKTVENESCEKIVEDFANGKDLSTNVIRVIEKDGSVKWVRCYITAKQDEKSGDIIAVIAYIDDIHEEKENEIKLKHKAQVDPLVGALNKKATESHINRHLLKQKCGVMFMMDLDNFKSINDNFGHAFGDEVLKSAYLKIAKQFRGDDILGRIGGDEFVAFSLNSINIKEVERKAKAICEQVKCTYCLNDIEVKITCSMGIAIAPKHGCSYKELFEKADKAMYECKKKTKDGYVIYNAKT